MTSLSIGLRASERAAGYFSEKKMQDFPRVFCGKSRWSKRKYRKTHKNGHTNIPKVTKMRLEGAGGIDFFFGRA